MISLFMLAETNFWISVSFDYIVALYNLQLIMVFSERKYLEDLRYILEDNVTIVMRVGVNLKELS
jgi:hypothetical protein